MDDIQKTVKIDFSAGTNSTPDTGICDCGGTFVFDTQRRIHICSKCKIIKRTVSKKQFQPGEIVADRYKILKLLAQGGMGYIYLCTSTEDCSVRYVLKTMNLPRLIAAQHQFDTEQRRIMREAKLLNALDHPNIVKVYDSWQDDSNTYIVMEYIDGMNLKQVMSEYDVDEKTVLQVARETAVALQHIWERYSIIHRDIKPENIMLDKQWSLKILDFGLSKQCVEDGGSDITMANSSLGTPGYMSPEQFTDSRNVDFRSDIFSLGATMFYLLTGKSPSGGDSLDQIYNDTLTNAPPPASKLEGKCSTGCINLIQWMMQKNPDDRMGSYMELLDEIDQLLYSMPD